MILFLTIKEYSLYEVKIYKSKCFEFLYYTDDHLAKKIAWIYT